MSRPEAIDSILLRSVKDKYAPPDRVLRLASVGDICVLTIAKYDETNKTVTQEDIGSIDVDLEALYDVVFSMYRDAYRSQKKEPV